MRGDTIVQDFRHMPHFDPHPDNDFQQYRRDGSKLS